MRACYLQTYQEFFVVDCVCMPDCIEDSRLETEYAISHEYWGVLVLELLTTRPGFKAAEYGLFSILNDVKLRVRRQLEVTFLTCSSISFKPFKAIEWWVSRSWVFWWGVWALTLTCAPFVYLNISASPVCQAWNQKLAVAEPEFERKKKRAPLEAIAQEEAGDWGK